MIRIPALVRSESRSVIGVPPVAPFLFLVFCPLHFQAEEHKHEQVAGKNRRAGVPAQVHWRQSRARVGHEL
jgi:hypothetical protein